MVTEEIRAEVRRLLADVTERKPEEISDSSVSRMAISMDLLYQLVPY